MAALLEEGCEEVQGYLVSRPLQVDAVPAFLAAWAGSQGATAEPGQAVLVLG
jgi:EAL domain-containing protein (putative c-di-GMP-specific phosphodiesterase class I)